MRPNEPKGRARVGSPIGDNVDSADSEDEASEGWLERGAFEETSLGPEESPMELEDALAGEEDEGGLEEGLGKKEQPVSPITPVNMNSLVAFFMESPSSC